MATRKKTTAASKVVEEPMQTKQAEETVVLDAPIESKSVGGSRTVEETIQTKTGLNLAKGLNLGGESGGGGGSGTDNYNDLSNRPQINGVTLSGNKSASDLGLAITVVDASTPPASMDSNKVYQYGTLAGDTTFPALATPADTTIANVYCWTFSTPSTAPTITWPTAITSWDGGSAPTINASKTYEVSVMDGLATIIEA